MLTFIALYFHPTHHFHGDLIDPLPACSTVCFDLQWWFYQCVKNIEWIMKLCYGL